MKILVINAGSSSLKYQLIDMDDEKRHGQGPGGAHRHRGQQADPEGKRPGRSCSSSPSRTTPRPCSLMIKALTDPEKGVDQATWTRSARWAIACSTAARRSPPAVLINEEVKEAIRANIPLGPAAQPRQPHGHRGLREGHARHAQRGRVRYRLPSDHAAQGLPVRRAL